MPGAGLFSRRLSSDSSLSSNWIDWLRLAFALAVLFSHSFPLMTKRGVYTHEPLFILTHEQKSLSAVAVIFFFVISGFLVVRSWLRSKSMQDYFHRRVLRIHPAYIVALVVSLVLAALSAPSAIEYLRSLPWARFLFSFVNLEYGALDVPRTAFPGNPLPLVNASMWTIQLEFIAYAGVAAYGLFGLFQYRKLWLVFLGAVIVAAMWRVFRGEDVNNAWGFFTFFIVGATYYLFRDCIPRSRILLLFALASMVASTFVKPWFSVWLFVAAPYVLFYVAFLPAPKWAAWTSRVDLSYGTYLYAWVIQESVIQWLHVRNPYALFAVAAPIALLCAAASCFLVERPCLRLKSRDFSDRDAAAPEPRPT